MSSRHLLLAGAAALVLSSVAAEPPNPNCPPGQQNCSHGQQGGFQGGQHGQQGGFQGGPHGQQGGFQGGPQGGFQGGPQGGPDGWQGGANWHGGPGPQGNDWHWQDNNGWHRDHDRYWQPRFNAFIGVDRVFFNLRRHHFDRFDGQPYWFHGRYVVRTFDRFGHLVFVEVNPYTGEFIGVVQFRD